MIKRNRHLLNKLEPETLQADPFHRVICKKAQFTNSESMQDLSAHTIIPVIHSRTHIFPDLLFTYTLFLQLQNLKLMDQAIFTAHLVHIEHNTLSLTIHFSHSLVQKFCLITLFAAQDIAEMIGRVNP